VTAYITLAQNVLCGQNDNGIHTKSSSLMQNWAAHKLNSFRSIFCNWLEHNDQINHHHHHHHHHHHQTITLIVTTTTTVLMAVFLMNLEYSVPLSFFLYFFRNRTFEESGTGFSRAGCSSHHPSTDWKSKHWTQPVAWPHPFFSYQWTPEKSSVHHRQHFNLLARHIKA